MNDTPTIDGEQPSAPERLAAGGRVLALLLVFIVPLGLRSYPLEHGGERGYVPDAHIVRNALGMAQEKNPVPPVGRFSTYPNLLPYMLLPVYGAQFFAGQQQELWDGPEEFGQHVLMNPASVHHPARWLVAILGSLTPLVVFAAAREARLGRGAWVAGWLVTTRRTTTTADPHESNPSRRSGLRRGVGEGNRRLDVVCTLTRGDDGERGRRADGTCAPDRSATAPDPRRPGVRPEH